MTKGQSLCHIGPHWRAVEIEVEYFSWEVNDLIWAPKASTLFESAFLRFCRVFPAILLSRNADASGV